MADDLIHDPARIPACETAARAQSWLRRGFLSGVLAATAALGACQDLGAGSGVASGASSAPSARIDAPGVPIAFDSIVGPPDAMKTRLAAALAEEATARQVDVVQASGAAYRLKGYFTAYPLDNGTTGLSYVFDVFDAGKKRSRRIEGTAVAKAPAGSDPWAAIDAGTLDTAAAQSMNEVAGFLAATSPAPAKASVQTAGSPAVEQVKSLGFAAHASVE